MTSTSPNDTELLVRLSRRSLWIALGFIVLLGAGAIAMLAFPASPASATAGKLWTLLPVFIIIAVAALRSSSKGARLGASNPAMKAILNDELRQASLARSYRNGFIAMLLLQPLLAVVLTATSAVNQVPLMAGASALAGAAVFLASLLYFDR
jgi:hypothetical protein